MNSTPLPYLAPPHMCGLGTTQPSVPSLGTFQNAVHAVPHYYAEWQC